MQGLAQTDSKAGGACQWAGIGAGKMQGLQWAKGRKERCAVTADVTVDVAW